MNRKRRAPGAAVLVALMTALAMSACGQGANAGGSTGEETSSAVESRADTGFVVTTPESYDSADTAILIKKNKNDNTVTLLNLNRGRNYTLSMDGTTHFYDKYGESVSLDQIAVGDIVDVTFLKSAKHLTDMKLSAEAWRNEGVSRYEIDYVKSEVTIGEDIFKLTENTCYTSRGQNIEKMDLVASDVLDFQGIGNQVLSVKVAKGHGYLRLLNDENFVGGWIEIGQTLTKEITEDMLVTVPEGSYQVNISNRGSSGVKNVTIHRNEETTLDIGDVEVAKPQTGIVIFSVSPAGAEVYLDGTRTDVSEPVDLEYGIHQMIVKAEGYKSITQYIRVGQASAGINVVLESLTEETEEEKEVTDVSSDYYKVHVDAPDGAEVYLDGNYMGIAPCSFKKEAGAHVITLRKTGYVTRSYTVQVDEEEKDISYSFADLEASEDSVSGGDN